MLRLRLGQSSSTPVGGLILGMSVVMEGRVLVEKILLTHRAEVI